MAIRSKLFWFSIGLAAATVVTAMAGAGEARAQTMPQMGPQIGPGTALPAAVAPPRPRPAILTPGQETQGARSDSAPLSGSGQGPTRLRGAVGESDVPASGESNSAEAETQAQPQLPGGLRAAIRDGDLKYPPEPQGARDGVIDVGEPLPAADGIDPVRVDARPPEDSAPFEHSPAAPDPFLLQIEDIEPAKDRRTERLFRFEPYDPIGIRIGAFVLFPEAEVAGAAFSNKLRAPLAKSDTALELKPTARLVSDWSRHAVEVRATGSLSFNDPLSGEDDRSYTLESRGRLDIAKRTNLQALYSRQVTQESRSGIDANRTGDRADITTDQLVVALNHRFNRLSVQIRGGVTDTQFSQVREPTGELRTNLERNFTQTEEAIRGSWEFKPTLSAFVETALVQREYEAAAQSDGISRNSQGERVRAGVAFGETSQILRGEASVGWGRQSPDDARLKDTDALLFDANVAWRASPLTSLLLTAKTDIADTTSAGGSGVVSRQVGIEVRHAFRRNLIATGGMQVTRTGYNGIVLDESEVAARLGAEYHLNREMTIFSRYQHVWFNSTEAFRDYEADEIRVGMRIRR